MARESAQPYLMIDVGETSGMKSAVAFEPKKEPCMVIEALISQRKRLMGTHSG